MTPVPDRPSDLLLRLRSALSADLAPEVAEILLPVLVIQQEAGGLVLQVPNAAWAHITRSLALPSAERWLERTMPGLSIRIADVDSAAPVAPAYGNKTHFFADFLADPGNQIALATCRRVVEQPGLEHNPLFLHGPAGSGKSHLLQAVCHEYRQMLGADAAVLLTGSEFVASGAQELSQRTSEVATEGSLRGRLEAAAVIALDGVDTLGGRDLAQEELFHVMNSALDRGAQLLFAARQPPRRLPHFTERLASRLAWGLTVGMDAPHLETRVALVRRIAGSQIGNADIGQLTALIEAQAPDMHQAVILAERLRRGGIELAAASRPAGAGFDRIVQVVADHFRLRPGDLTGQRRHSEIVHARGLALLLGRRLTGHSMESLGGMVGGRDHTTVLHALRTTEAKLAADPTLQRTLEELTRRVLAPDPE
jgi:chromosomal replication initiator protein